MKPREAWLHLRPAPIILELIRLTFGLDPVQQTTGLISTSITFFNKATLSVYDFPYSNTLTLGQMLFATVALYFMKSTNIISYKDFSFSTAKAVRHTHHSLLLLLLLHLAQPRRVPLCCDQVLPLAFFFFGMVVTGLAALQFINVPMFRCVKPSQLAPATTCTQLTCCLSRSLCVCRTPVPCGDLRH